MSENDVTITKEEALFFIREELYLKSIEQKVVASREVLLNEIVAAMQENIPFHTLRSLSTPQEDRHLPTLFEIKNEVFAKIGGLCYTLNVFCSMLLRALGFDVFYVPSDCRGYKDVHMVLVVRNLTTDGSTHMIDVGAGCPSFHAISFDFEGQTSPVYQDSFLRYRFVREGAVVVRQHNVQSDSERACEFEDCTSGDWFSYLSIHPTKVVDASYFSHTTTKFYTEVNPDVPFLTSLRCLAFPNGRFVCIKDTTLLVEIEKGRVQKSYFRSRDEILAAFDQYFPQLPTEMVKSAMRDENINLDFTKAPICTESCTPRDVE